MDYQPMQPMQSVPPPKSMPSMDHGSSTNVWWIVGAIVVLAAAGWYFYGTNSAPADTGATATEQSQTLPLTAGNTTADISADLAQTPDTTAALDADASAVANDISGL